MTHPISLAIHGGTGVIPRHAMSPDAERAHRQGLRTALLAGHRILMEGGSAIDAVTASVVALEDDPLFNAGHGAVFTSGGAMEMDAAIMRGADHAAGAVAGGFGPRNPVKAARAVMERSDHVLLAGQGAIDFCRSQSVPFAPPAYFHTEPRWLLLQAELERRRASAPDDRSDAAKHGTVGAVARDRHGHLAAATSTGGMTAKLPGRVGDSPLIGAGTWADDATCAVSATGHGEFFIRYAVAHDIAARLRYQGISITEAAETVIEALRIAGGAGGVIAIDRQGSIALPFNCHGMYRGMVTGDGDPMVAIWTEAPSAD